MARGKTLDGLVGVSVIIFLAQGDSHNCQVTGPACALLTLAKIIPQFRNDPHQYL